MSWDTQLEIASFMGVTFNVEAISDELARRLAEYKYPWRNGADFEDLGREPRRTQLTAVFQGPEYEAELGAFIAVVDKGEAGNFIHPILGSWNARIIKLSIDQDHSRRDFASVSVEVVEDGTSTELPDLFSIGALEQEVDDECDLVEAANTEDVEGVSSLLDKAREFAADAQSFAGKITSTVNQIRKRIDSVVDAATELTDFENYALIKSVKRLGYSCQKLGTRVEAMSPTILRQNLAATMPFPLLAHKLYGDKDRADDLQTLNRTRNPFIAPGGDDIKVYGS